MTTVVAVTGSSGFIGRHVVNVLLRTPGVEVIRIVRSPHSEFEPKDGRVLTADIFDLSAEHPLHGVHADVLIHLAWRGVAAVRSDEHRDQVADHVQFLKGAIDAGVSRIICAGTCFEYGLAEGQLDETSPVSPVVAYAEAKTELHRHIVQIAQQTKARLLWARIFYPYGPGQHPKSLWTSLQDAIDRADPKFPMSPGMQVRDYLPVEEVGAILAQLACGNADGVLNICSGEPVVLRHLVEGWIRDRGSEIEIEPGVYGYPDYEPMEFWGSRRRLNEALAAATKED